MLNISSKTRSHILVLIFGPHVPLWLPSIVTLHLMQLRRSGALCVLRWCAKSRNKCIQTSVRAVHTEAVCKFATFYAYSARASYRLDCSRQNHARVRGVLYVFPPVKPT